jgi:hypothetical protein
MIIFKDERFVFILFLFIYIVPVLCILYEGYISAFYALARDQPVIVPHYLGQVIHQFMFSYTINFNNWLHHKSQPMTRDGEKMITITKQTWV